MAQLGLSSVAVQGPNFVAIPAGAGSLRYVLAPGGAVAVSGETRVAVGSATGWSLIRPPGTPAFKRIAAFGRGFLAVSRASNRISLWYSDDGAAWSEVRGVPQPVLADGWTQESDAFSDLALVVSDGAVVIVGSNEGAPDGLGVFSIVGRR